MPPGHKLCPGIFFVTRDFFTNERLTIASFNGIIMVYIYEYSDGGLNYERDIKTSRKNHSVFDDDFGCCCPFGFLWCCCR